MISLGAGATLTTIFQTGSSAPVADTVASLLQGSNVVAVALADTNGVAVFSDLAAGTYTLIQSAYGFANVTNVITVAPAGLLTNASLTTVLGSVSGQVTDATGGPIAGLAVSVYGAGPSDANIAFSVSTDADGRYALLGLRAGSYVVTFGNNGGIEAQEVAIEASLAPQTLNFTLPGVLVQGVVLASDGATPVHGATVTLAQTNQLLATAMTDTNGLYRFRILLPGAYELEAGTMDGISSNMSIAVGIGSNVAAAPLTLGSLQLQGDVTDTQGQPLANAMVALLPPARNAASQAFAAVTSSNGQFLISGLVPGQYTVFIHEPGFAQLISPLNVSTTLYQSFALSTGLSVSGQITEAAGGRPISNSIVALFPSGTHFLTAIAASDDSGQYTAVDLPAGTYDIIVSEPSHQVKELPRVSLTTNALNLDAALAATNALVRGTVTDASANALAGAQVNLADPQTGQTLAQVTTDADGTWSTARLPAGTYQLTTSALGYLSPEPMVISVGAGVTRFQI